MSKVQSKPLKRKFLIPILLLISLFSTVQAGIILTSTDLFEITSVEISAKSSTVDVHNFSFEKFKINNDITFHQVGDSITYKIKVKNNDDRSYTIKSVKDDNTNRYISYIYDGCEGTKLNSKEETTIEVTEKYITESSISDRNQNFSVNITFSLEDENGNVIDTSIPINTSSNPKTGDNVGVYILIASISFIMLLLLFRKNKMSVQLEETSSIKRKARRHSVKFGKKGFKLFSLFIVIALLLPTILKAATEYALSITFESKVALKDKLVVSYTIDNRNYEIITPYNTKIEGLNDPEIPGYEFDKWEDENGNEFNPDTQITDDVTITAKLTPITYTISYDLKDGNLEDGKTNPTTYTIETADIELNKPKKEGYVFAGWIGTELTDKTENVTVAKGSIGNREYTANWTEEEYTITYNLNGGTVFENPTTYTIESDDIILNKPTKEGYTFAGWTGTDLADKTEDVTITKGSTGKREYTSNWIPIVYTINYSGLTEEEETALNNPTTFTIETERKTLNNPQDRTDNDGDITERFVGWKEGLSVSLNITIPAELENKTYEATWVTADPNVYTITYNLDGGTVETENRTSFTKFDTFTLNNPSKRGYTFKGWTGSNGTNPELTVTVQAGIRENLNYTANWEENTYSITYDLNGGTVSSENPATYTVNSNTITLNNPTKTGYTFKGWTGTDLAEKTMEVTIQEGSIENREYVANFEANTYTIVFDRNTGSGSMSNQEATYDQATNLKENAFTKTGYSFTGWNTKEDGTGINYSNRESVMNLSTGTDVTLYAQWSPDYLMVMNDTNGETLPAFDNNFGITKAQVEKVYTLNTRELPSNLQTSVDKQWDVSEKQNGSIIAYALDTDSNSKYEIYICQDGGVKANPNSKKLFNYYINATYMDLSNLITDDVTTMLAMFQECGNLIDIAGEENWKTDNVESLRSTFNKCRSLTSLDVSNFNTERVTDMQKLFCCCSSLQSLNLTNFDTTNVTSMYAMFYNCPKLTNLDISSFDTTNVTDMSFMFSIDSDIYAAGERSSLTNIVFGEQFKTDNVISMQGMFINCDKLNNLDVSNWNTSNVTNMSYLFSGCSALSNLNVSNWNTSNVTTMACMFADCSELTELNVSNWRTPNLTSCYFTFNQCYKLTNIDLSNWNMSNVINSDGMFQYCIALQNIVMPNNYIRLGDFMFNHNSSYDQEKFTIPASVNTFEKSHIFYNFGTENFKIFEVEEGNTVLKTIDDILYTYDGTILINIPMGKTFENNRFELPEGVTFLNELSFNRNKNIKTLVLPNSYEIERFIDKNNNSYGFINSGSSLNVAIYMFSSIREYEVKSDNPRYSSYEGCIYSKDETELIAVPLQYSGTLNIKDGTTTIGKEAIWAGETSAVSCMNSLTEINIPASVTTIEANQITALNELAKKGVTINIDSANTAYEMSDNTIVAK